MRPYRQLVRGRGVPHVGIPTVHREHVVKTQHPGVTLLFGQNRCAGDDERTRVSLNQAQSAKPLCPRARRIADERGDFVAIDKQQHPRLGSQL